MGLVCILRDKHWTAADPVEKFWLHKAAHFHSVSWLPPRALGSEASWSGRVPPAANISPKRVSKKEQFYSITEHLLQIKKMVNRHRYLRLDHLNLASSAGHHHLDSLGRIRFRPIRRRRWCQVLEKSCWHDPRQRPFFGRAEKNTISVSATGDEL